MQKARAACATLVACGLVLGGSGNAWAAGEEVTSTVAVKKVGKIKKKKPAQARIAWNMTVAKPDGSRPANLHTGELKMPKGTYPDVAGFEACPLATIETNDVKSCPAKSIVGKSTGTILSAPVRDKPYDATGVLYYTGLKGKVPQFASYFTLTEIPSAHSITTLSASKSKLAFEMPKIPTAPGLPDATPLQVGFTFDAKGSKGLLFKQKKACAKGTTIGLNYGFYDSSAATGSASC